ncbi:hypothetical protein GCM10010123_19740 [Pilimelia anulata]|uniref:Uncharacterized protein n=1 Tax=Pilimelia anulata TaxID=53371 RepID=A0A8J3B2M9_9ACTN|nr:hypothetical protein [Pilimelia anulata]GGJ89975.1 hypothetical protein GCM10010123_19740 [Pilimelia anulata]
MTDEQQRWEAVLLLAWQSLNGAEGQPDPRWLTDMAQALAGAVTGRLAALPANARHGRAREEAVYAEVRELVGAGVLDTSLALAIHRAWEALTPRLRWQVEVVTRVRLDVGAADAASAAEVARTELTDILGAADCRPLWIHHRSTTPADEPPTGDRPAG